MNWLSLIAAVNNWLVVIWLGYDFWKDSLFLYLISTNRKLVIIWDSVLEEASKAEVIIAFLILAKRFIQFIFLS